MTTATLKKNKNTSKVGGKNENSSLFVLEERANYKTSSLCGINKAPQRAWSCVCGLVFAECGQSHFPFTNKLSLCIPVCLNTLSAAALLLRHPQTSCLCDSFAPLTLLKQTRALCPFFRAPLSPLCICDKNGAPDYFQTRLKRVLCALWALCSVFLCYL